MLLFVCYFMDIMVAKSFYNPSDIASETTERSNLANLTCSGFPVGFVLLYSLTCFVVVVVYYLDCVTRLLLVAK